MFWHSKTLAWSRVFITGKLIETLACAEIIATYIQVNMNQNRSLSPRAMWHSIPADYFQLFSAFFCEIICLFYWEMLTSHCKVIIFCHFTFYTTQSVIQLHFTQHSSKTYKNMSFSSWMVKYDYSIYRPLGIRRCWNATSNSKGTIYRPIYPTVHPNTRHSQIT